MFVVMFIVSFLYTIVVARSLPYPELLDITVHLPLTFQNEEMLSRVYRATSMDGEM